MRLKFKGTFQHFQNLINDCGGVGEWSRLEPAGGYQFRSLTGEIINWWPSTGTVYFQGKPGALQSRFLAVFVRAAANDDGSRMVSPRAIIG